MTTRERPGRLEIATIQPIAHDARHGTARDLFTVWFGCNIMLLTVVTGGLAVTVFHLSFVWAVLGLTVGNLVGGIFMALHAAQGPTLGVPQMVQTRGQFGSVGSLLVVGIVLVMYVGFLASNLVLSGEALASLARGWSETPGILLVSVLGVVAGTSLGLLAITYRNEFLNLMRRWTGWQLFPADIYGFSQLPALILPGDIAIICGGSLVICLLAAAFPARHASRLNPVEALRHE